MNRTGHSLSYSKQQKRKHFSLSCACRLRRAYLLYCPKIELLTVSAGNFIADAQKLRARVPCFCLPKLSFSVFFQCAFPLPKHPNNSITAASCGVLCSRCGRARAGACHAKSAKGCVSGRPMGNLLLPANCPYPVGHETQSHQVEDREHLSSALGIRPSRCWCG